MAWWQQGSSQQWWQQEQWRQCRTEGCHAWNAATAMKCHGCGLKKNWAQVVKSPQANTTPPWKSRTATIDDAVGPASSYPSEITNQCEKTDIDKSDRIRSLETALRNSHLGQGTKAPAT